MLLLDFGERNASIDMAKSALLAANWETDWTIQQVLVNVLENAYSTLYAQEALQASQITLNEAEKVLNIAKELNRTGLTPITDVYTSQATFYQTKMDYTQHKSSRDIERGKLAASMGLSATSCFEIVMPESSINMPVSKQVDDLIAIAYQQRTDLLAQQARIQEKMANKLRTKAAYLPKLYFNGREGFNRALRDKTNGAQYEVALNFEMPIFNGFDTIYQNRIAYAEARGSIEELIELQIDIALEVLTHSRQLQASQEMLPDAEANLTNSTNAYEGVLEKYKAGKETITDVSIAQRQLAAARLRYIDVKTKLLISMANLAYATGTLAPYMETPCQENPSS
jgi:outer membrane protein TolC